MRCRKPFRQASPCDLPLSAWPGRRAGRGCPEGEFEGECVMGLALGKDIQTDCSVNTVYKGKTYCFGNETARTLFLKRPDDFLLQAHIYYSSKEDADTELKD